MRRRLLIGFLFSICLFPALRGQTLTGVVADSTGETLPSTTVVLLNAADSVLYKFSLTDREGAFRINGVKPGDYILQLSFLGYQNYMLPMTMPDGNKDLGRINLSEKSVELGGVTIEAEIIPIIFKKDTIEYNADAFKVQPDAPVEDLLKRLPGVEVDKDGNVKAQGEDVNRILVDGKEFFGDDPKVATKNLPANAVDKVQVFDKQSEIAEFTGIDDGERMRTINLELKEDKKKGYFGNVSAGYGTEDRFKLKGNINRFSKKTQLSVIGMANNVNEQGFSINDYISFMGGLGSLMSGGGIRASDVGIPLDNGLNNGIVTTGAGGFNFNADPSKKTKFRSNYFFSGMKNDVNRNLIRQSFIQDATFETTESNVQTLRSGSHRLNLRYEHDIDSLTRITFIGQGKYTDGSTETDDIRQNFDGNGQLSSSTFSEYFSEGANLGFDGNLVLKRRFNKRGRALVGDFAVGMTDDESNGTLDAVNTGSFLDSLIFQNQDRMQDNFNYRGKVSYTEPLGGGKYLEANYLHSGYMNQYSKLFFDVDPASSIEVRNDTLSNVYDNTYVLDRGGLTFQVSKKKLNFNIGVDLEHARLEGDLISNDTVIRQTFTNPLPRLRFRYRFANTRRIDFNYRTNVREPSVDNLSPVIDNSDPLRITTGNPDLRAEYVHTGRLHFMSFSQFSFVSFFGMLQGVYTQNKITNAVTVNPTTLVQLVQPINVDRDIMLTSYFAFGAPVRPLKIEFNTNTRITYNRSIVFVNANRNNVDRIIPSIEATVGNRKKDKVDLQVGANLSYNNTTYDVDSDFDQSFVTQEYTASAIVYLTKKWIIDSDFTYTIYGGQAFAQDQTIPIWRASVSRFIGKFNRWKFQVSAFDILNQNTGVNRTANLNFVEEETFVALRRYVMGTLSYSISGFKKEQSGRGGRWMRHMVR